MALLVADEFDGRGVGGLLARVLLRIVDVLQDLPPHAVDVVVLRGAVRVAVVLENVSE